MLCGNSLLYWLKNPQNVKQKPKKSNTTVSQIDWYLSCFRFFSASVWRFAVFDSRLRRLTISMNNEWIPLRRRQQGSCRLWRSGVNILGMCKKCGNGLALLRLLCMEYYGNMKITSNSNFQHEVKTTLNQRGKAVRLCFLTVLCLLDLHHSEERPPTKNRVDMFTRFQPMATSLTIDRRSTRGRTDHFPADIIVGSFQFRSAF